jgi:hypothetical protein
VVQVEDQVDDRVLVEQAQLAEGEGSKDGHCSGGLEDNDHGVGYLTRRWAGGAITRRRSLGSISGCRAVSSFTRR